MAENAVNDEQKPSYEARTEGVWYVDDDAQFGDAWQEFRSEGLSEIGLDVEFTQTYDEKGKRQRMAALVQMTSDRGTLLYHSWRTADDHRTLPAEMRALFKDGSVKKYGFGVIGDAQVLNYTFGADVVALVELQVLGFKLYKRNAGIKYFCEKYFDRILGKELDAGSSWRDPLNDIRQKYARLDADCSLAIGREMKRHEGTVASDREKYFKDFVGGSSQPSTAEF